MNDSNPGKFTQIMKPFLDQAQLIIYDFETRLKINKAEYEDLLRFFCYNDSQVEVTPFSGFFGMLDEFLRGFEESRLKFTQGDKDKKDGQPQNAPFRGKISDGDNPLAQLASRIKVGGAMVELKNCKLNVL